MCNRGVTPTFVTKRASSVIEITLCSRNIFESIHGWRVNKDVQYSDHRRIEFNLKGVDGPRKAEQWALKKANWKVFQALMKDKSEDFKPHRYWTAATLDAEAKRLGLDIKTCLRVACDRTKPKQRRSQRWWSKELETQRRKVRGLHKLVLKKGPDDTIWDNYKFERNKFKSMAQKAKRESWKKFTSDIANVNEMASLTKSVFRKVASKLGHLKKPDGSFTNDGGGKS